jgi:Ca2+-binding RTX toxin-like protein
MLRHFKGFVLAAASLAAAGCADEGVSSDPAASLGESEGQPADLSGVRIIGAALTASDPNLGATPAATPVTDFPTSGDGANVLTVTLSDAAHTAVLGFDRLTKALKLNGANVPCASGCRNGRGDPITFVSIDARSTTSLKRVVVTLGPGAASVKRTVVFDYRTGGTFLPGTAAGAGVTVDGASGDLWDLGIIGGLRTDTFVLGATGASFDRDLLGDVVWDAAEKPQEAAVFAEAGNDTITGGGSASLVGDRGVGGPATYPLFLEGWLGKDKLSGGLGADELSGGDGDDTFPIEPGVGVAPDFDGADRIVGGNGSDTADFFKVVSGPIVATMGKAFIPFGKDGTLYEHRCLPAAYTDKVWPDGPLPGTDVISALHLAARQADGRLVDPTCDVLGASWDAAPCATEGDRLEVERVIATNANDDLFAGCGPDIFLARGGDDYLRSSGGMDLMQGDAGNDYFDEGSRRNGATGLIGGAGVDTVDYRARSRGVRLIPARVRPGFVGVSGEASNPGDLGSVTDEGDQFSMDFEVIHGSQAADHIIGTNAANTIHGYAGDDTLLGMKGNDLIYAGDGNDVVYGGVGNDRLWGDLGADLLRGDAGNDELYGDRGTYCQQRPEKRCAADGDCGVEGPCVADAFCPRWVKSCDDVKFGGAGLDVLHAGTSVGSDILACGAERGDDTRDAALRRIKDKVTYAGATGAVEPMTNLDDTFNDGQRGFGDAASYGLGDFDSILPDCELLTPSTPPTVVGATWELQVSEPAAGTGQPFAVGEAVVLTLTNSLGAPRTDIVFETAGIGGRFVHPRLDGGEFAVTFIPEALGSVTFTAFVAGAAVVESPAFNVSGGDACTTSCPDGFHCALTGKLKGTCIADSCYDGLQSPGYEEGIDCGGLCDREDQACPKPTCADGIRNGAETGLDCGGGTCEACLVGAFCAKDRDCALGSSCRAGVCQATCDGCAAAACDSAGLCTACEAPAQLVDGRCVAPCPSGSIHGGLPAADGRCICTPGTYLSADGASCSDCTADCASCGPGGLCEFCKPGFLPNAAGACVALTGESCPATYDAAPVDGQCQCQADHVAVIGEVACKPVTGVGAYACPANSEASGGRCKCAEGFYMNPSSGACSACPAGCLSCEPDGAYGVTCTSCEALDRAKETPPRMLFDGRCVLGCPSGTVRDGGGSCACPPGHFLDGGQCRQCSANCRDCDGLGACSLCAPGSRLLEGQCTVSGTGTVSDGGSGLVCAPGHTFNRATADCERCNGMILAGVCIAGNDCPGEPEPDLASGKSCVCDAGKYALGEACVGCSAGCEVCTSAYQCSDCEDGYTLWDGICVPSCPAGLAFDPELGRCGLSDCAPLVLNFMAGGSFFPGGLNTVTVSVPRGGSLLGALGDNLPVRAGYELQGWVLFFMFDGKPFRFGLDPSQSHIVPSCQDLPITTGDLKALWGVEGEKYVHFLSDGEGLVYSHRVAEVDGTTFANALAVVSAFIPSRPSEVFSGWWSEVAQMTVEDSTALNTFTTWPVFLSAGWTPVPSCNAPCETCDANGFCATCQGGFPYLMNGTCLASCPEGLVPDAQRQCIPRCSTLAVCDAGNGCVVNPGPDGTAYCTIDCHKLAQPQCDVEVSVCSWNGGGCVPDCRWDGRGGHSGDSSGLCGGRSGCYWGNGPYGGTACYPCDASILDCRRCSQAEGGSTVCSVCDAGTALSNYGAECRQCSSAGGCGQCAFDEMTGSEICTGCQPGYSESGSPPSLACCKYGADGQGGCCPVGGCPPACGDGGSCGSCGFSTTGCASCDGSGCTSCGTGYILIGSDCRPCYGNDNTKFGCEQTTCAGTHTRSQGAPASEYVGGKCCEPGSYYVDYGGCSSCATAPTDGQNRYALAEEQCDACSFSWSTSAASCCGPGTTLVYREANYYCDPL